MKIEKVLFDLDGTLLPMNQDDFIKAYFGLLAKKLLPHGYETNKLIETIWAGTKCMIKNNGIKTNEEVFWDKFCEIYGIKAKEDICHFDEYYKNDFDKVQLSCGFNPKSKIIIDYLKGKNVKISLATNPIFPSIATEKRIKWAGLDKNDFEIFTTYENSFFSKPNLKYYEDLLKKLDVNPKNVLMIGNDVSEDMICKKLGINVFLLTDNLINKENENIENYPNGNFDDLLNYLKNIFD